MAIEKRKCQECEKEFYGSINRKTCSNKCRQSAHRKRKLIK